MKNGLARFCVFFLCVFCWLFTAEGFCASGSRIPFRQPFSHYAENEGICSVLADFARAEGYGSICSPALVGEVSGRFDQVPPQEFLEGMRSAFGVLWYTQGQTVTFWQERENTRAFLAPATVSASALLDMFRAASMISPQLPVEVLSSQNLLSVSGPPLYVEQLREAMAAFEAAQGGRTVMRVFPLRYAWAEDMSVNSMDAVVTIPGVASILRAMVSGAPVASSGVSVLPSTQERLLGQGMASVGKAQDAGSTGGAASAPGRNAPQPEAAGPSVIADPRVNAVLVTDAEYRMSYYAKVIADLDKPVDLVEIHAAIVDIDSNFSRDLGINYSGAGSFGGNVSGGGSGGGSAAQGIFPSAGAASDAGLSFSTLYSHGTDYFLARVNALEEDGQARVLGKPSVLTMDNVQASLENTSTYYIPVAGKDATDLFKVDSGTVLKVTPHIIPGEHGLPDTIKLMVSVQDDRDDGSETFSVDTNKLAPIKQTKINTQAIVSEGQSLLIGGYYFETQSDNDSGIPGLKNIPVLGGLFGSSGKKHQRMERLILITPRVVRMDRTPEIPARVDDPRFSRTPTQADYEERAPLAQPVGGCARRAELAPATPPSSSFTTTEPVSSAPAPLFTVSPVSSPAPSVPSSASSASGGVL